MFGILYNFLIMPGLLFTAFVGLLSTWVDRKVTARIQWRVGPPLYQPFADILKLLGKETFVPNVHKLAFISAPLLPLIAVPIISTILWYLNINAYAGFTGDLVVVVLLLAVPSLALMIGGSVSKNPLSALGARREIRLLLAYEVPFVIAVSALAVKTGSILIGKLISHQAIHGMNIGSVSGAIAFFVSLMAAQAQLGFAPFESTEAEQEIESGPLLEYSGYLLAAFKLTKAMMLYLLPVFLITFFLGGIDTYTLRGALLFILKYFIVLASMILIKNTNPRIRIDQAVRFFWGPITVLALLALFLAKAGF
jgi:NADH-quinone oxidoreductase subunit H